MASLNKVILIGNLGADPELRHTTSGQAVANLRLATTRSWKPEGASERKEETTWHGVVVWGKQAESCAEYLRKGRQICVEGRLTEKEWTDKDGNKRKQIEVVAENVIFLGGGGKDAGGGRLGAAVAVQGGADGGTTGLGRDDDIPF